MDTYPLVKDQIDDGRRLLEQLVHDGFDVTAAFWLRFEFEEIYPWFCIVSKTVDEQGLRAALLAIHAALHRIPAPWDSWLSAGEIGELHLIGVNDPLAKDVLAFHHEYPGKSRFRGVRIGDRFIEELYIYPPASDRKFTLDIGTPAEPELIDLERVPLVTIIRDSAAPSKVVLVGGGKPQRTLEGEDAQRIINQFDAIQKQMK